MRGFRDFISRGNVVDLAVAVIIGAAFTAAVTSLTADVLMPVIGYLSGGLDFSSYFIRLGPVPAGFAGDTNDYEALKAAGVPMIGYAQFVTTLVNFLIVAFIVYLIVKALKQALERRAAEPVEVAADPEEILLLRDIRDALRQPARGTGADPSSNLP